MASSKAFCAHISNFLAFSDTILANTFDLHRSWDISNARDSNLLPIRLGAGEISPLEGQTGPFKGQIGPQYQIE